MKKQNTFGVYFTIRQNRMQEGKCPVYLRIFVNGTRSEISLKALVHVNDWNLVKGMAKPKHETLKLLFNRLEDIEILVVNYYWELRAHGAIVTAEDVKNAYLRIEKQDTGQTLIGLAEEHYRIMANVLKPDSLKKIFTTLKITFRKSIRQKILRSAT